MALDIKDRVPTRPGRIKLTAEDGTSQYYTMERADEPSQEGTPINKSLLDDMCKAENTLVSSDVQTFLGVDNVDDGLKNALKPFNNLRIPQLIMSDYIKLHNLCVNSDYSGQNFVVDVTFNNIVIADKNLCFFANVNYVNSYTYVDIYINGNQVVNMNYACRQTYEYRLWIDVSDYVGQTVSIRLVTTKGEYYHKVSTFGFAEPKIYEV